MFSKASERPSPMPFLALELADGEEGEARHRPQPESPHESRATLRHSVLACVVVAVVLHHQQPELRSGVKGFSTLANYGTRWRTRRPQRRELEPK